MSSRSSLFRSGRIIAVAALAALGLLGLTTDTFRSPRAVARDSLRKLLQPADGELRFIVDARLDPARAVNAQYYRLQFRAGPGPLKRAAGSPAGMFTPFELILERRGVTLRLKGDVLVRDGVGYLRMREMPAYGDLGKTLEGRWLKVSDPVEASAAPPPADQPNEILNRLLSAEVLQTVARRDSEEIRGIRTREYRLGFEEARLRETLRALTEQFPEQRGFAALARYLDRQLEVYRIEQAILWVRPRSHQVVRARLVLVPKTAEPLTRSVIFDATVLPRADVKVPPAPEGAVRLRPETIQRILGR